MTLVIEVTPEVESRLQTAAARRGLPVADYARALLERQVLPLAIRVAALPPDEQDRLMAAAAAEAADLYDSDLSLPEASLAIQYGASALGLVSEMPSGPGVISEDRIREIASQIPPLVSSFLLTCQQDAAAIIAQQRRCDVNTIDPSLL